MSSRNVLGVEQLGGVAVELVGGAVVAAVAELVVLPPPWRENSHYNVKSTLANIDERH